MNDANRKRIPFLHGRQSEGADRFMIHHGSIEKAKSKGFEVPEGDPDAELRDSFESPEHEDAFLAEREIGHVLDGAGPDAVAAMPGVARVKRIWKERLDGKERRTGIDVCFQWNGQTAWFSFPGGQWCEGRIGIGRGQLSPELFGDYCFLDERGRCWGKIEEDVRPDPEKLAAFRSGRGVSDQDAGKEVKASAHDPMVAKIAGLVCLLFAYGVVVSLIVSNGILGKALVCGAIAIGAAAFITALRNR